MGDSVGFSSELSILALLLAAMMADGDGLDGVGAVLASTTTMGELLAAAVVVVVLLLP